MKLTILGSGTCVPTLKRNPAGYLLSNAGKYYLIDLGPGTMKRLLEAGVSINNLDGVFLSHFHLDHSAELAPLIFALKYAGFQRTAPLPIFGPVGLTSFYRRMEDLYGGWILPEEFTVIIKEAEKEAWRLPEIRVVARPALHHESAVGFRFQTDTREIFAYSGDTDYCEEMLDLARNSDVFLCECSFPDNQKVAGHLTPSLAGRLAGEAEVKKLVLTHFYPPCEEVDLRLQAQAEFKGEIILAEDLMEIEIK